MKILITGVPGVGKTTLSQKISFLKNIENIEISKFIKDNKLYINYDPDFDTFIFDEKIVRKELNKYVSRKRCFIVDTHSPELAKSILFDYIIYLKCDAKILGERLGLRRYSEAKILENIESQIFDVIGEELEELYQNTKIWTVNGSDAPLDDVTYSTDEVIKLLTKE